jgi:hypothetical protein
VQVDDVIDVTIAVDALASIKQAVVTIDGVQVAVRNLPSGSSTLLQERLTLPITPGAHVLQVTAIDWDGTKVVSPAVDFLADVSSPALTLATGSLGLDDTWGMSSQMLRFRGSVSDDGTIAAVQLRVGDGSWTDVIFDATSWRGAINVPAADGTTLSVAVRAVDLAGRTRQIAGDRAVDLTPTGGTVTRPSTTIQDGPSGAAGSQDATFEFSGAAGSNGVAAFTCRLDDEAAVPCRSPLTLTGLASGPHQLEVTAIDSVGYPDVTPARQSWSVAASGPQAIFTSGPTDPSSLPVARFTFEMPAGATATCALDRGVAAACTSPIDVTVAGAGPHTFQVQVTSDRVTGTASSYPWSVVNEVPVTCPQLLQASQDDADGQPVRLIAVDFDDLDYRIVKQPAYGFLEGIAPNLSYVPFAGYHGPDVFSFVADDGQLTSAPATVDVTVHMAGYTRGWDSAPDGCVLPVKTDVFGTGMGSDDPQAPLAVDTVDTVELDADPKDSGDPTNRPIDNRPSDAGSGRNWLPLLLLALVPMGVLILRFSPGGGARWRRIIAWLRALRVTRA